MVCCTGDVEFVALRAATLPNLIGLDPPLFVRQKGAMKQLVRLTILFCSFAALPLTAVAGPEPLPSGKEMKEVAPVPECDFSWTGFHLGGNYGSAWANADTNFDPLPDAPTFFNLRPTTLNPDPDGFFGGGQIGFNWQWNRWLVLGVETDFQGTDIEGHDEQGPIIRNNGTPHPNPTSFLEAHERMQWFGTGRARIGFVPMCRVMVYATGGVAYGNVDYSAQTNFGQGGFSTYPVSFTETKVGWTAGAGIEYVIWRHWSLKSEYLYYDLGDADQTQQQITRCVLQVNSPFFVHYNFATTGNIIRSGFNFNF